MKKEGDNIRERILRLWLSLLQCITGHCLYTNQDCRVQKSAIWSYLLSFGSDDPLANFPVSVIHQVDMLTYWLTTLMILEHPYNKLSKTLQRCFLEGNITKVSWFLHYKFSFLYYISHPSIHPSKNPTSAQLSKKTFFRVHYNSLWSDVSHISGLPQIPHIIGAI